MELTRVKPFGKRRKTYFYGVAGTVLAAHVVVGAIIHVMPPELEEAPPVAGVQMQIVDHFLPDDVVESSAVRMVEDAVREEIELPVFEPVWEPDPLEPSFEPIGPTESVLPEMVVEVPLPEPDPVTAPDLEPALFPEPEEPAPVSKPPVKPAPKPAPAKPVYKKPPVKKKAPPKPAYRPPVKKKVTPPAPRPAPKPVAKPEPERAIPVAKPTGGSARRGLLDRRRARSAPKPAPEKYVQASWSKRPPPFYPAEQRKRGVEGTAHVRVSINSSGRITAARLVKSTGNAELDRAALSSVKKGSMNPARRGSRSVSSEMIVPFEFYR